MSARSFPLPRLSSAPATTSSSPRPARPRRCSRARGLPHWPCADPSEQAVSSVFEAVDGLERSEAGPHFIREVFAGLYVRAALPGVRAAVSTWLPDVIVRETHELAAALIAERFGVPQARIGIMREQTDMWDWVLPVAADALAPQRRALDLWPDPEGRALTAGPLLTLSPRHLEDPAVPPPAGIHRFRESAGPANPLPDWWPGDERPLVYLTFGSEVPRSDRFPALYRDALAELAALPVRVLVTVGETRDPADLGPLPANAHAERWVPQADVMPHAAAIVCHGGFGSTRAALAAGVPLAVLPFFADQPVNAARVADLGAGIALDSADGIGEAVERLLRDPSYTVAAAEVAADVHALPTVDDAPRVLRELLTPFL